jgi:hypothetical protein
MRLHVHCRTNLLYGQQPAVPAGLPFHGFQDDNRNKVSDNATRSEAYDRGKLENSSLLARSLEFVQPNWWEFAEHREVLYISGEKSP